MKYLFSHYVSAYRLNKDVILYSTLSRKSVRVPIEQFSQGVDFIHKDTKDLLKEALIIIPECINENKVLAAYLDRVKDNTLNLVILTTEKCNFSCKYCYQMSSFSIKNTIDSNFIATFINWINSYLKEYKDIAEVQVCFFGGEPLLNFNAISSLCDVLKKIELEYSIAYSIQLVTNGSLLDFNKLLLLSKNNLKNIEITLDGPAEIHNIRRPYANGKGSYDAILNSLKLVASSPLLTDTNIILRVNADADNIDYLKNWIIKLSKLLPTKRIELLLSPVIDSQGYKSDYSKIVKINIFSKIYKLYIIASKMGFIINNELGHYCTFERSHQFVITPSGSIYKCNAAAGLDKFKIGALEDDLELLSSRVSSLKIQKRKSINNNDCLKCKYFPLCRGGCRYQSFIEYSDDECIKCRYDYYDLIIPFILESNGIIKNGEKIFKLKIL